MATTHDKEKQLQLEIAPRVEHDLPGVEVLAVELQSPDHFTVYVDRPEGVDLALCEQISGLLRDYTREYTVDVSSPGIERPLRKPEHFAAVLGQRVTVRRLGSSKLKGTVADATETYLVLDAESGEHLQIPYAEIVRANLIDEGQGT